MGAWLLKFGFGGVQAFIAQARKLRDLAEGSRIVSHLAGRAVEAARRSGAQVLLPVDTSAGCPHQLLLRVPGDGDKAGQTGEALQAAVERAWTRRAQEAIDGSKTAKGLLAGGGGDSHGADLDAHLAHTFQTFWVAVPEEGGFEASFRRLQRLYDARRLTRTFPQLPGHAPAGGWTCYQCGARPAVVDRKRVAAASRKGDGRWSRRDRLCAVCLAKRELAHGRKEPFPSTLRLARDRLFREPVRDLLEPYGLDEARWIELMDRWDVFEERARTGAPGGGGRETGNPAGRGGEKGLFEKYLRLREDERIRRSYGLLSPYYAMVVFDGDRMGRWLSGEYLDPGTDLEAFQQDLSRALGAFARSWIEVCRTWPGVFPVYAGGDDGLAVMALDHALPFLRMLRTRWHGDVAAAVQGQGGARPTLSAHVSVVHERAPLQVEVARLHADLERAKERGGRNVFSVRAAPRAGAAACMVAGWDELDPFARAVARLSNWRPADVWGEPRWPEPTVLRRRGAARLPGTLPHKLLAAARPLFKVHGACICLEALGAELERVADRSGGGRGAAGLVGWLCDRAGRRWPVPPGDVPPITSWEALESALSVTAFLARQMEWKEVTP